VLNNHNSKAIWCCSEDDGDGLWHTREYPESVWLDSLGNLTMRYHANPFVIGYDLRNELRGVPFSSLEDTNFRSRTGRHKQPDWGSGRKDTDWAAGALRGALAVIAQSPDVMVFIEGINFATDLSGLQADRGPLHHHPDLRGRVVYEAHDYTWYHKEYCHSWYFYWLCVGWALLATCDFCMSVKNSTYRVPILSRFQKTLIFLSILAWSISTWLTSYHYFTQQLLAKWAFLLERNEVPVWLGEFGTNGISVTDSFWSEVGEVTWWRHIIRYIRDHDVDYAYWALNGDKAGEDETFGLLKSDYATVRYPWLINALP